MQDILNFDYIWFLSQNFWNLNFETIVKLWIVYFFVLWIAIIIWVTKDIINRTNNIFFQLFSILIVLFWTPLWVVVYLLIRPGQTLFEKYYEDDILDEVESEDDEDEPKIKKISCPSCSYIINSEYKFCPNCRTKLKNECISCHKDLKLEWTMCPYCWADQDKKIENILTQNENISAQETKEIEHKNPEFDHIDVLSNQELINNSDNSSILKENNDENK